MARLALRLMVIGALLFSSALIGGCRKDIHEAAAPAGKSVTAYSNADTRSIASLV